MSVEVSGGECTCCVFVRLKVGSTTEIQVPRDQLVQMGEAILAFAEQQGPFRCAECRMGKCTLCDYADGGPCCCNIKAETCRHGYLLGACPAPEGCENKGAT